MTDASPLYECRAKLSGAQGVDSRVVNRTIWGLYFIWAIIVGWSYYQDGTLPDKILYLSIGVLIIAIVRQFLRLIPKTVKRKSATIIKAASIYNLSAYDEVIVSADVLELGNQSSGEFRDIARKDIREAKLDYVNGARVVAVKFTSGSSVDVVKLRVPDPYHLAAILQPV
ncbi:hypothetical protein [Robiginitomaculum antarcticum]|uniref:hypothetical protein n=1 Tax=Robiginitomaculum antarcticum TaxID=437507 RepID=UPI00037BCA90|nr:hypothetical protein [Robiginitomaculum antarcticum]